MRVQVVLTLRVVAKRVSECSECEALCAMLRGCDGVKNGGSFRGREERASHDGTIPFLTNLSFVPKRPESLGLEYDITI